LIIGTFFRERDKKLIAEPVFAMYDG
jgi:hypothetical protein